MTREEYLENWKTELNGKTNEVNRKIENLKSNIRGLHIKLEIIEDSAERLERKEEDAAALDFVKTAFLEAIQKELEEFQNEVEKLKIERKALSSLIFMIDVELRQ